MRIVRSGNKIFPLLYILSALIIIFFGLIYAKNIECSYFLLFVFLWLSIFGAFKSCLKMIPAFIVLGGIFAGITYFASRDVMSAISMLNRFGAIFLGLSATSSRSANETANALSQVKTPRALTFSMRIMLSAMPLLKLEIKRIREAMKTRGAGSFVNLKVFYRAFLVPLIMRLVNISDILSLSVETRGFSLTAKNYTVYKIENIVICDYVYILGIFVALILAGVL